MSLSLLENLHNLNIRLGFGRNPLILQEVDENPTLHDNSQCMNEIT